jgi:hypothetical protein
LAVLHAGQVPGRERGEDDRGLRDLGCWSTQFFQPHDLVIAVQKARGAGDVGEQGERERRIVGDARDLLHFDQDLIRLREFAASESPHRREQQRAPALARMFEPIR